MSLLILLIACSSPAKDDVSDDAATDTGGSDGGTSGTDGGTSDTDGGTADSDDPPTGDTGDPCYDVPTVTYNNFGKGFMTENCQGCHATTAPYRYGAPEDVYFDTVDDCWIWADRILVRSTGDSPTMPPQGGPTEDDRTKLEWWLTCAEPGT